MRESREVGEAAEEGERVALKLSHTVVVWVGEVGGVGVPLGGLVGVGIKVGTGVREREVERLERWWPMPPPLVPLTATVPLSKPLPVAEPVGWALLVPLGEAPWDAVGVKVVEGEPDGVGGVEGVLNPPTPPPPPPLPLLAVGKGGVWDRDGEPVGEAVPPMPPNSSSSAGVPEREGEGDTDWDTLPFSWDTLALPLGSLGVRVEVKERREVGEGLALPLPTPLPLLCPVSVGEGV